MENFKLNSIEEALDDFREGKIVIVVDDEDRENEGDFIIAAEKITPEITVTSIIMGIILAFITGRTAVRKKQYYILLMCMLFVLHKIFTNVIASLPSFFVENPIWIIRIEMIILLFFLVSCFLTYQRAIESKKYLFPLLSLALFLRIIRIVYLRNTTKQLRYLVENHEKYLEVAQQGMIVSSLLLCGVQLVCFLTLLLFYVNLRKTDYQ